MSRAIEPPFFFLLLHFILVSSPPHTRLWLWIRLFVLVQVKGCTTLIPPLEVLLLSENSVREVCAAVWVGCFTANPSEVAFDLLCRLMR